MIFSDPFGESILKKSLKNATKKGGGFLRLPCPADQLSHLLVKQPSAAVESQPDETDAQKNDHAWFWDWGAFLPKC